LDLSCCIYSWGYPTPSQGLKNSIVLFGQQLRLLFHIRALGLHVKNVIVSLICTFIAVNVAIEGIRCPYFVFWITFWVFLNQSRCFILEHPPFWVSQKMKSWKFSNFCLKWPHNHPSNCVWWLKSYKNHFLKVVFFKMYDISTCVLKRCSNMKH